MEDFDVSWSFYHSVLHISESSHTVFLFAIAVAENVGNSDDAT